VAWFAIEVILGAGPTAVAALGGLIDGLATSTGLNTVAVGFIAEIPPISIVLPPGQDKPSPKRLSARAISTLEKSERIRAPTRTFLIGYAGAGAGGYCRQTVLPA
jgi:hypothetical protein